MKNYRIYRPTSSEIELARYLSEKEKIDNEHTVDADKQIYGYLFEIMFNNLYADQVDWVGLFGEYRWDFVRNKKGDKAGSLTIDCKAKPVKRFPPPLNYHCGLYKLDSSAFGKADIYAFGAVTEIPTFKDIRVAFVGWEYCEEYLKTAKISPKGTNHPDIGILKYDLYEKKYRDLQALNGSSNT